MLRGEWRHPSLSRALMSDAPAHSEHTLTAAQARPRRKPLAIERSCRAAIYLQEATLLHKSTPSASSTRKRNHAAANEAILPELPVPSRFGRLALRCVGLICRST